MNYEKVFPINLNACIIFFLLCGACNAYDIPRNETTANEENAATTSEEVGSFISDVWLEGADMMRILWKDCSKKILNEKESKASQDFLTAAVKCVKRKTLKALDRSLSSDVIPLAQGVELVRYQKMNKQGKLIKPYGYNYDNSNKTSNNMEDGEIYENSDWKYTVLEKMIKVFNTHVLKIDVSQEEKVEVAEFRHRRRNQMMQMMMFGIMSMGMILVPMGFQFLAVLGGKALLLAKFALVLSSIQALKKASASSVNYAVPITAVSPEHAFEKRGYDTPVTDTELKTEMEHSQPQFHGLEIDNSGKIAYRFDHNSKVWKPQQSNLIKRADTTQTIQKIYPVYSVTQTSPNLNNLNANGMNEMRPVYAGFQPMIDGITGNNIQPTEIHAEYTIDLPIDKVQIKSTSPFITSETQ